MTTLSRQWRKVEGGGITGARRSRQTAWVADGSSLGNAIIVANELVNVVDGFLNAPNVHVLCVVVQMGSDAIQLLKPPLHVDKRVADTAVVGQAKQRLRGMQRWSVADADLETLWVPSCLQ